MYDRRDRRGQIEREIYERLKNIFRKIQSESVLDMLSLKSEVEGINKYLSDLERRKVITKKDKNNILKNVLKKFWNEQLSKQFLASDCTGFTEWDEESKIRKAMLLSVYLTFDGLKSSQLRKFLDLSINMNNLVKHRKEREVSEKEILSKIIKMRYLLAYQAGKEEAVKTLVAVLDPMLQNTTKDNFEKFYEFLQAVVAYHKFFGGAD